MPNPSSSSRPYAQVYYSLPPVKENNPRSAGSGFFHHTPPIGTAGDTTTLPLIPFTDQKIEKITNGSELGSGHKLPSIVELVGGVPKKPWFSIYTKDDENHPLYKSLDEKIKNIKIWKLSDKVELGLKMHEVFKIVHSNNLQKPLLPEVNKQLHLLTEQIVEIFEKANTPLTIIKTALVDDYIPQFLKEIFYFSQYINLESIFKNIHNHFTHESFELLIDVQQKNLPNIKKSLKNKALGKFIYLYLHEQRNAILQLLSPLIFNAHLGNLEEVQKILATPQIDVNFKEEMTSATALIWASARGHLQVGETLLKAKANIEAKDCDGNTALMWASASGHLQVVETLLKAKANIEAKNYDGNTALMMASWQGHLKVAEALLNAGANIEAKDVNGNTALMKASEKGHLNIVETLKKAKADIEAKGKKIAHQ